MIINVGNIKKQDEKKKQQDALNEFINTGEPVPYTPPTPTPPPTQEIPRETKTPMGNCFNCRWWDKNDSAMDNVGGCHRHSPTAIAGHERGVWPLVEPDWSCGDFEGGKI